VFNRRAARSIIIIWQKMKSNEKENERIENGGRVRRRGGAAGDDECVPGASELGELAGGGEDDERDVGIAEHGELLRLLEQPPAALRERHLPRRRALYPPYLPRHLDAAPPPLLLARKKRRGRARPLASHMRNPPEAPAGYTRAYSSTPRQEKGGCLLLGSWRVGFRRRVQ
jgi:hypothetical protein